MSDEHLGPQILSAVKFLRQIYHDLEVLVRNADKVFDEKGWTPTHANNVFARLGNKLKANAWLMTRFHRFYVPKTPDGQAARVIAVIPVLDPPEAYAEPICTACAVSLARPVKREAVSKYRRRFRNLLDTLEGQAGTVRLSDHVVRRLFPQATAASVIVVPLCDLTGEHALVERLIAPALATQRTGS